MNKLVKRDETEYLQIAGIQHFVFCRRQWALIHIEQQWSENFFTLDGTLKHEKVDEGPVTEKLGNKRVLRSLHVISHNLQIQGICDVVELIEDSKGEYFSKYNSNFKIIPVEYKRGKAKEIKSDILQLAAQTMWLEEMLGVTITKGAIFYFATRHRETVTMTKELYDEVKETVDEMNNYYQRMYTPKVKKTLHCRSCSLADICLPEMKKTESAKLYVEKRLNE